VQKETQPRGWIELLVPVQARGTSALLRLSAAFFLTFWGGGAFQQFIGPYLQTTYHLTGAVASAALATVYLMAFVCLTFATYTIHWLGERGALIGGTLAYAVFPAVALVSGNPVLLVLAAAVWGWGSSALWTAGTTMVLDLAEPGQYGRASGTLYTGVYVGQALGVLMLGFLVNWLGPRGMVATAVIITLAGTAVALNLPYRRRERAAPRLLNPFVALTSSTTRTAALILLLSSSGFGLLLGVFGHVVSAVYGLAAVGWVTSGFYIARIPSGNGGGRLIDRVGRRPVLGTAFLASSLSLLLTALLHQPWLLAVCAVALGVHASIVPIGLATWVGDRAVAEDRPHTYAAVSLWSNVGTGLAILGGQSLLTLLGGWQGTFALFSGLFFICALLTRRLN
jgi:MFS family permease